MKKILAPLAIVALTLSVSSCDFFRALAGRPTSAQLTKTESCCEAPAAESCCGACDSCRAAADTCCAACDSCRAAADTCCAASESKCCASEGTCCGACSADSIDEMVAAAAAVVDSCMEAAAALVDSCVNAAAALVDSCCREAAAVVEEAVNEVCEQCEACDAEAEIIQNLEQKTGFLKVSVSYNDVDLLNTVESGYYILMGTFAQKANAERVAKQAQKAGLEVTKLEFANGRTAVGVLHTTELGDAFVALGEARKFSFCPKDACILVVE